MTFAKPEKARVTLGIIPLTDCAPIAVAKERGFFERYGLDVTISREPSWASLRDRLMVGDLDGAHMLAPMLAAMTLGLGAAPLPMMTALSLGLNGNAITVSNELHDAMIAADPTCFAQRPITARALRTVIADRKRAGKPLVTFAMVFPFSMHNYLLRYWLSAAGIHPDRDLRLIVVPPPQMGMELAAGNIDGFCSGSPWNHAATFDGCGHIAITGYELWNNAPEKVLGVSQHWAHENPNTHAALIAALIEASQWINKTDNILETAEILSSDKYIGTNRGAIEAALVGRYGNNPEFDLPDFHVFHRYQATYPWVSHAVWILTQMYRWGQLTTPIRLAEVARSIYRPDLYRRIAAALNLPTPQADMKKEGQHSKHWKLDDIDLGPDRFLDARGFDPALPVPYLEGFDIHSLRLPLDKIDLS